MLFISFNTIIGFTDPLGIAPLVNHEVLTPINNQNQNTSVDPTIYFQLNLLF